MSDSSASPPIAVPPSSTPSPLGAGDVDIEMLLNQAQALVDDAADDFDAIAQLDQKPRDNAPPTIETSSPAPPAEVSDILNDAAADLAAPHDAAEVVSDDLPLDSSGTHPAAESPGDAVPDVPVLRPDSPSDEATREPVRQTADLLEPASAPEPQPVPAPSEPGAETIIVEDFAAPASSQPVAPQAPSPAATAHAPEPAESPPPESTPHRRDALPARLAAAAVLVLDRPFARSSDETRRRLGWIAVATLFMGVLAWLAPVLFPPSRHLKQKTPAAAAAGVETSLH